MVNREVELEGEGGDDNWVRRCGREVGEGTKGEGRLGQKGRGGKCMGSDEGGRKGSLRQEAVK